MVNFLPCFSNFSPVYSLLSCISNKIHTFDNRWCDTKELANTVFSNDTVREQFISQMKTDVLSNRTSNKRDNLWLDAVDRFSLEKCPCEYIHLSRGLVGKNRLISLVKREAKYTVLQKYRNSPKYWDR